MPQRFIIKKEPMMKNTKLLYSFLFFLAFFFIFLEADNQQSLADLYRIGKIRFLPELTIDDGSMPEDVFFQSPYSITGDNEENIYVCDYRANNIKKFSASGKFVKIIGREGQGPGEFSSPFRATFAKDRLVVWDMRNMRLCALSADGEFIKAVKIDLFSGNPRKLRSLPNGDIVIQKERVFFGDLDKPQECTIEVLSPGLERKKIIYSHNIWRNKYIRQPRATNIPQPYASLVYWDVSPDGRIIIGFSEKYEVEIYDRTGEKLTTFTHSYEPLKVTNEDKKEFFSSLMGGSVVGGQAIKRTQGAPDYIKKNAEFPSYKPAFNNIIVDSEGNILVFPYRKMRQEMYRYFDAFDSEGNFIANVQVVGDVPFPARSGESFLGRYIWTRRTGEDGLTKVIKYKISN